MARRRTTRKRKKRFQATSISALLPGTLSKGRKQPKRTRRSPRKRAKPGLWSKLSARWGFSHYFAMLLALSAAMALFLLVTDPRFVVASAEVQGAQYLDAEEVVKRASVERANVFLINPDETAERIRLISQVKDARVRVGLPNLVRITVTERQPVLNYVREGETFWVDEEGHIFLAPEFRIDLPVLLDDDSSAALDDRHMDPALAQAITALSQHMPDLNEFRYRRDLGLYFLTPEGWRVLMGDGGNMEEKLAKWRTIRQQLLNQRRQVETVDLRYDNVYVR